MWHRSPEQAYSIAPADDGGWEQWGAALLRLFGGIGHQPTQAVITNQEVFTERYIQVMIGHGIAHTAKPAVTSTCTATAC